MINIRERRFWTILAVAALSLLTMASAWPTLRFGLASQGADAATAAARLGALSDERPIDALAQKLILALAPPKAPAERVEALQALIGATPMASGAWLDLAIARQQAGQPMETIASALAMSSLTGPNEARFMGGRAAFGLPLWDKLPPDVRRGLIGDLIAGWGENIGDAQRQELNALLTVAPDQTRSQILAALLLAGKPGEPIIKALDLAPPPPEEPAGQGAAGPASPPAAQDGSKP